MAKYIDAEALKRDLIDNRSFLPAIVKHAIDAAPACDVVEVVRCKDCYFAKEFDKHCEFNRTLYRHCDLWHGDEIQNVWHKYKKYYRDYSIVEIDGFCSDAKRKDDNDF